MTETEYQARDGCALGELVRAGEVTPAELVELAAARMERVNPALNAVVHPRVGEVRGEGERGSSSPDLPFPGVPFLIKDLVSRLKGHPHSSGSRLSGDFRAPADSEMVRRWREAGLLVMGSTNTPEFGLLPVTEPERFGPARNPWDTERTPGGSSGGSAAAVAAGIVPLAGAGDGGGSIRIPASCCGLFGLKPTRGRTPFGPDRAPPWRGMALEHVVTRSVRDSARALDAVCAPEPGAPNRLPPPSSTFEEAARRDPPSLRIAWTDRPLLHQEVDGECLEGLAATVGELEALGHQLEEVTIPLDGETFARDFLLTVAVELAAELEAVGGEAGRRPGPGQVEPETWALALFARSLPASEWGKALRRMERAAFQVSAFLSRWDLLLTPTLASPPVRIGELTPSPMERLALRFLGRVGSGRLVRAVGLLDQAADSAFRFTPWTPVFNATGQPAMSVPLHRSREGLPVGMHFVGRFGDEETLLSLAGQLERVRGGGGFLPRPVDPV